jgi:hypothetical protein
MLRRVLRPLWVLLAVLFLIEAWFWDHLEPVVAWIVQRVPLRELKARLTLQLERLSPAMALIVFVVPLVPLYPLKLLGLYLLAGPNWLAGVAIFALAQIVGLGVIAFIFDVTKPKLLQMAWFAWLYRSIIRLRGAAHALVAPIMAQIREVLRGNGNGWSAKLLRRMQRLRRNAQESR